MAPEKLHQNNLCAYAYSRHLLKQLAHLGLISLEEFDRISRISAAHYGVKVFYV